MDTTMNEKYDDFEFSSDPEQRKEEIKELLMEEVIYCEPSEQFARLLYGTEFEYGILVVAEEMPDGWCPDHMEDCPESLRKGWIQNHELCVATHPKRGVILLCAAYLEPDEKDLLTALNEIPDMDSHILSLLSQSLGSSIEKLPLAVLVHGIHGDQLPSLDPSSTRTFVPGENLLDLPRQLEEILDSHAEKFPDSPQGPQVLDDLREAGYWIGSNTILQNYLEEWVDPEQLSDILDSSGGQYSN